jgi:hypothetical protein
VEGVACHFTVPERGGLTGWIGVAEEVSHAGRWVQSTSRKICARRRHV